MNAKTKFLKMFYQLPVEARMGLVYDFTGEPMTLNVIALEVRGNTGLSKKILKRLGFKGDEP